MEIIPYMDPMGNNLNLEVWLLPASREVSFCPLCFFRLLRSYIRNSLRPTRSMVQRVMIPNFGDNQLIFTSLDLPNSNMSPEKRFFAILEALEKTIFWFDISFLPWFLLKVKLAYLLKKKNTPRSCCKRIPSDNCGTSSDEIPKPGRSSRQVTLCMPLSYHWVLFKQCFTVENEG